MQSMKSRILSVFPEALLQLCKGINSYQPIEKNAKPHHRYWGFVVFKPKSRCAPCGQFASFWLKYKVSAAK